MADQPEDNIILRLLIAGGREAVDVFEETGLSGEDVEVFVAGNGGGAMCELSENTYDLVIIDHSVARVDGLRLAALIRSTPLLADLPLLLIVEPDDPLSRLEGHRVGADAVFLKPVDADQLAQVIVTIVGSEEEPGD